MIFIVKKYRDTGYITILVLPVAKLEEGKADRRGQLQEQLPPGAVQQAREHKKLHQNILTTKVSLIKFAILTGRVQFVSLYVYW